ncbi:hypothetical protein ACHAQJ_000795 [Trichoderma viride]
MSIKPTKEILCNGLKLVVTENLQCCLKRLRKTPSLSCHNFWVDAICINQEDLDERARQVKYMADIYTLASVVISWLGEEDEHTKKGFELLESLSSSSPNVLKRLLPGAHTADSQLSGFSDPQSWLSVVRLFQRTYFSRVWIIQEVVLAKKVTVMCGSYNIDWKALADASHFFSTTGWRHYLDHLAQIQDVNMSDPAIRQMTRIYHQAPTTLAAVARDVARRGQQSWTTTLLHSLIRSRDFKATDPRDKVYSLLGLVQASVQDKPRLTPAYLDQTHDLAITYTNLAIQVLEESDNLLLLSCVEGESFQLAETGNLPSWVPDWSCPAPLGLRATGYKRYNASGNLQQRPIIDADALTVTIKGTKIDDISLTGESKHEVLSGSPFPAWLRILETLSEQYCNIPAELGGEHKIDAFWRSLIANTFGDPPKIPSEKMSLVSSFAKWAKKAYTSTTSWQKDSLFDQFIEYLDKYLSTSENLSGSLASDDFETTFSHAKRLRLFCTEKGYLGIGTECVEAGDSVWIIPGSRVPLILRPTQAKQNEKVGYHCRLVGGAYLHGFMQGEALCPSCSVRLGVSVKDTELEPVIIQ